MRTISKLAPAALLAGAAIAQACGSVPNDTANELPVKGVIRGNVIYSGPAPCSQNGHIVGNAIVLIFDRRNPPPPNGLANTAVNFGVVAGDALFRDQPRNLDSNLACPDPNVNVQATSSFTIAPMDPGSYVIQGFFDYTGDFLPTFKMRNLPMAGDVGGGFVDINDATSLETVNTIALPDGGTVGVQEQKQNDPNYLPTFLPVDVGTAGTVPSGLKVGVPNFTMPESGYVADNVVVTMGSKLRFARPYFYPRAYVNPLANGPATAAKLPPNSVPITPYGDSSAAPSPVVPTPMNPDGNPDFQPILTFPSSLQVYAPPSISAAISNIDIANEFQAAFPQIQLVAGVPAPELGVAQDRTNPANPFHMQIDPAHGGNGGVFVWWNNPPGSSSQTNLIPEGNNLPRLWPLVVLAKLVDDPTHTRDPQGVTAQGADLKQPIVIIQGITLAGDSLIANASPTSTHLTCSDPVDPSQCFKTAAALGSAKDPSTGASIEHPLSSAPDATSLQDHVTVMLRPSAVCIDPNHIDRGGLLVTPHITGPYPVDDATDIKAAPSKGIDPNHAPVVDPTVIGNPQLKTLVSDIKEACLPPGRYGINLVYPTGQAWTVPNESGACAPTEGSTVTTSDPGTCAVQTRPVLLSQGTRAVIEVLDDPAYCTGDHAVPPACTTVAP